MAILLLFLQYCRQSITRSGNAPDEAVLCASTNYNLFGLNCKVGQSLLFMLLKDDDFFFFQPEYGKKMKFEYNFCITSFLILTLRGWSSGILITIKGLTSNVTYSNSLTSNTWGQFIQAYWTPLLDGGINRSVELDIELSKK